MRSALIVGVSIVALSLGGCSWIERETGLGGGNQATASSQPTPATSMSGTSQAATPVPSAGPTTAPPPQGEQAQSGSTTKSASMHRHHMTASNDVRQAQQKLKDDGDYQGKIDGLAGPQTHHALVAYQQKNQLKQTGRLDRATRDKLGLGGAAASGSSMPAPARSGSASAGTSGSKMPSSGTSSGSATGGSTGSTTSPSPMGNSSGAPASVPPQQQH
ncbi:MAG TPA: peptidoglycan-binding domain-containing protein [Stellaceae bacterium]|nr:peptidoglycan-binding domain-containing protein [Stellaceae bacterium]